MWGRWVLLAIYVIWGVFSIRDCIKSKWDFSRTSFFFGMAWFIFSLGLMISLMIVGLRYNFVN